jgi:hypothetical protein
MRPVKIKYWGLMWLSKTGYLWFNGIGWLIATALAVVGAYLGFLPPFSTLWHQEPAWGFGNYLWWLFLACLAFQLIDAGVAWTKFAKKEEEQTRLESWPEDEAPFQNPESSEAIRERQTHFRRPRS